MQFGKTDNTPLLLLLDIVPVFQNPLRKSGLITACKTEIYSGSIPIIADIADLVRLAL
jgi:hypothetical protein